MLYLKAKLIFEIKAYLSRLNIKQNTSITKQDTSTHLSAISFGICDALTTWYIHIAVQIQNLC